MSNVHTDKLAERLLDISKLLKWNERGIKEGDPEVEIFLHILDLQS